MTNPATLLAALSGSLAYADTGGGGSLIAPPTVRYRPAQDARVNWLRNPRAAVNLTDINSEASAAIARVSGLSDPALPSGVTTAVTAAVLLNTANQGLNFQSERFPAFPAGCAPDRMRGSVYLWASAPIALPVLGLRTVYRDGLGASTTGAVTVDLTTTPQRFFTDTQFLSPTKAMHNTQLVARFDTAAHAAVTIYATAAMIELSDADDGAWFDGASLAGASWLNVANGHLGTAHAFPSVDRCAAWVEPAASNLVTNPWFVTDAAGWSASNGAIARSASIRPYQGPGIGLLTATGANAAATIAITAAASTHVARVIAQNRTTSTLAMQLSYNGSLIGAQVQVPAGGEAIIDAAFTGTGGAANLALVVANSVNGNVIAVAYLGASPGTVAPSPLPDITVAGTLETGSLFTGTANASPSTRAASTPSHGPAGLIDPTTGALAVRVFRRPDAGAETVFSVGLGTAGTDRLVLRVTAGNKLEAAWTSNGAAETVVSVATPSVRQGEWTLLYAEWAGTAVAASVGSGARTTGTRDAPQGSFGASSFVVGG